jgi:hypothetical protein
MSRHLVSAIAVAATWAAALLPLAADEPGGSSLAGTWVLNRSVSEMPREMAFRPNWIVAPNANGSQASAGGGRGRRSSGGSGGGASSFPVSRESYEDARRLQILTTEARTPPERLIVVDTPAAVTITTGSGESRVLHATGKQESIEIQGISTLVTTRRDADRLVVVYNAEQDRDLRYTYSRSASPPRLVVEVQLVEHGSAGEKARRVYDSGTGLEPVAPTGVFKAPLSTPPTAGGSTTATSTRQDANETFDRRPGAELRGLKEVGILVEDFGQQAIACGLNRDTVEAALAKRLKDGGFSVRTNSDEDTYLYVNVMTNTLSNGTCVSRYDAFLYTHATANLSYRDRPVLVQVSLMHRGGIGSSAPAGHGVAVTRGLESYVDLFVTQIRDANK